MGLKREVMPIHKPERDIDDLDVWIKVMGSIVVAMLIIGEAFGWWR